MKIETSSKNLKIYKQTKLKIFSFKNNIHLLLMINMITIICCRFIFIFYSFVYWFLCLSYKAYILYVFFLAVVFLSSPWIKGVLNGQWVSIFEHIILFKRVLNPWYMSDGEYFGHLFILIFLYYLLKSFSLMH